MDPTSALDTQLGGTINAATGFNRAAVASIRISLSQSVSADIWSLQLLQIGRVAIDGHLGLVPVEQGRLHRSF